jgi:hypothetical protein
MRHILILDDEHDRVKEIYNCIAEPDTCVTWTGSPMKAWQEILQSNVSEVWLDHDIDLSDDGRVVDPDKQNGLQGMFVVDMLVEIASKSLLRIEQQMRIKHLKIIVHSTNDEMRPIMVERLRAAGYNVVDQEFKWEGVPDGKSNGQAEETV